MLWPVVGCFARFRAVLGDERSGHVCRASRLGNGCLAVLALGILAGGLTRLAIAAPPWTTLVPFRKIDADPKKNYELEDKHGPWMIMAASFAGPSAEQQSHDLVLELRRQFKLEAYSFRRTYDFSKPTEGLGYSRYGGPRRMRI